jgi:multidrug resistance efflux pump
VAAISSTLILYLRLGTSESTDDAQIDGNVYPISSRVSGYVSRRGHGAALRRPLS